jgi:hypothetical protein
MWTKPAEAGVLSKKDAATAKASKRMRLFMVMVSVLRILPCIGA